MGKAVKNKFAWLFSDKTVYLVDLFMVEEEVLWKCTSHVVSHMFNNYLNTLFNNRYFLHFISLNDGCHYKNNRHLQKQVNTGIWLTSKIIASPNL